jgi:hypothetical protein
MRRTKTVVLPNVDVMEPRLLLSTAAPLLSKHALAGAVREVRAIVGTLARTEDTVQASAQLTALATQISPGSAGLALSWQRDIGLYRPHSARSVIATDTRIVGDLNRYNHIGVSGGNQPASGSGSTTSTNPNPGTTGTSTPVPTPTPTPTPTPAPAPTPGQGTTGTPMPTPTPTSGQGTTGTPTPVPTPSVDSVKIENTSGLPIVVTVHLIVSLNHQPSITETIPAQGNSIASFDFGTATNAFMTMDVRDANGGQGIPPPFTGVNLSQPQSGYDGVLFTISLFGPYFSVNVPT